MTSSSSPPCTVATLGLAAVLGGGCGGGTSPVEPEDLSKLPIDERVEAVLARMTLAEKIAQKHGSQLAAIDDLYHTPDNERLAIPGFRMVDGPRGVRAGTATAFPVGMARGATWDPELERRVGEAMGLETAAKGGNVLLAPTINVLRHPGWGRAQETYGEDPRHIGTMGAAFIEGVQRHVIASAKHFALNSIEDTRFSVDVSVDERTLHEIYLPHFRMAVQAGVGSVMSAYNLVNGHYCAENAVLLSDILRDEWGFEGFVESDWFLGTHSTAPSALAGLDIEMPGPIFFGNALLGAVESGQVPVAVIDASVRHILHTKFAFGLDHPDPVDPAVVQSDEHRSLAREVAEKSIVLLKNEGDLLPLDRTKLAALAVVGPLAAAENIGDEGSSKVTPSYVVTPLAGIEAAAGSAKVTHIAGPTLSTADEAAIAAADAAVVVVGLTGAEEGEKMPGTGGDRDTLALPPAHAALVAAVAALNPTTIVVLEGGASITMVGWIDAVPAVLMAWYPGMEGGTALASILFGDVSPSGKLPVTFPVDETQLPAFVHTEDAVSYGYYHGYRHVDHEGLAPLFPFGHGLSYTSFAYSGLAIDPPTVATDGELTVSFLVENTGPRAGEEIAQLYVGYPSTKVDRPERELRAFARVALAPGEKRTIELTVPVADLGYYDVGSQGWRVETVAHRIEVGPDSRTLPLTGSVTVK